MPRNLVAYIAIIGDPTRKTVRTHLLPDTDTYYAEDLIGEISRIPLTTAEYIVRVGNAQMNYWLSSLQEPGELCSGIPWDIIVREILLFRDPKNRPERV